jgi:hypothetical protein
LLTDNEFTKILVPVMTHEIPHGPVRVYFEGGKRQFGRILPVFFLQSIKKADGYQKLAD